MEAAKQVIRCKEFIEKYYMSELLANTAEGRMFLVVDFVKFSIFDPDLAHLLLEKPEDVIKACELAIEQFDLDKDKTIRMRFYNIPQKETIFIRNIRSKHLGKFVVIQGIVRQKSDVRPQIEKAKFECPSCGTIISLSQSEKTVTEPKKCHSCGYKGKFSLIDKELTDMQAMVLEEASDVLEGGQQPKRLNILLKEDLVSPITEKKTNPGSNIRIYGILKEITIESRTGGKNLTKYDLVLQANNIEPLEEDYSNIKISLEEKKKIKELSDDPRVFEKLTKALAPGIYGHERVKEAILLLFFGGVMKSRSDGVKNRGDTHILLIGDPGCIAGESMVAVHNKGLSQIRSLGTHHMQKLDLKVTKIRNGPRDKEYDVAKNFQHYKKQPVLRLKTETGKEIICTYNQPFMTKDGWKRADEIDLREPIRVMPSIPNKKKSLAELSITKNKSYNAKDCILPKKVTGELASFLGYFIGDGSVRKYETTIYINQSESDLQKKLEKLMIILFGVEPKTSFKLPSKNNYICENGIKRDINSSEKLICLQMFRKHISDFLQSFAHHRVPLEIFQSPKPVVAKFISWLFEADGCCFSNGRGKTSIQLKSHSKELLKDVQQLFLFFGIQSRIIEDNLCIRRTRDMSLYAKHIGFQSKKKKKKLQALLKRLENINLQQQVKTPQRWEKIIEITCEDKKIDVFDFEIPRTHSFIANGILCHNSGKSQLLKRAEVIAPKGKYVSGKGASGAGLCVSPKSKILSNPGGMESIEKKLMPRMNQAKPYNSWVWKEEDNIDFNIQCMNDNLQLESKKPSTLWKLKAPKFVYNITLQSGKQIELTGNTQLFSIHNGKTKWVKSMDLEIGEYIATPRKVIGGDVKKQKVAELIKCNPVIHDCKADIKKIITKLAKKYGSIREVVNKFTISENKLYHHWVKKEARGNIKLHDLKRLSSDANVDYTKLVNKVSLYNGKNHTIPTYLSKDFLYVAGLIAGDGDIRKSNKTICVRLSNSEEKLHEIFQETISKEYSLSPYITQKHPLRPKATRFSSKILGEVLLSLGIPFSPKSDKIIMSEIVLHLSNELLAEYIAGLFDSDGSVNIRKSKGSDSIELYSCSKELISQLQLALLRYEIRGTIRKRQPTIGLIQGKHQRYSLTIRGSDNINRFKQNITLRHPKKRDKLAQLKNTISVTNVDIIPGITEYCKSQNISLSNYSSNISYNKLKEITKTINNENLYKLSNSDIFWEKITNIKKITPEYEYVYDLTVEKAHNFVVDGILVHNTASVVKDEFLGGWALEAGALPLSNKGFCLSGDTEIMLETGKVQTIKEINSQIQNKKKIHVTSFNDKTLKLEPKPILKTSKRKANDVNKITFESKDTLTITNEHPLPVWNNGLQWKKVSDIKEGEYVIDYRDYKTKKINEIVISTKNNTEVNITKEYAELLGLIITDGTLGKIKNNFAFYTKSEYLEKRFKTLVAKIFNVPVGTYIDKRSDVKHLYFSSKKAMQEYTNLGVPRGQKSKKIGQLLINHSLPKNILLSYLTGIINGDGSISNKKSGGAIDIICGNKVFAQHLQKVCRKCGIIGHITTLHQKGGGVVKEGIYENYSLTISGKCNIQKLEKGLFEPKKKAVLYNILQRTDNSGRIYHIDKLFEEINLIIPHKKKNILYKNGIKQSQLKKGGVNRETLRKTIQELDINDIKHKNILLLKKILKKEIYFNKIISIQKEKPTTVYNIEVADNNTYFANFIPTHNCIIDELDKMSNEDTSAMHEALEQQSISISKANIQATLRCETTVLAAANPKLGRFDPYEPLAKQINLPPALINRFDLIFPFRDEPDEKKDEMLARFVLGMHKNSEVEMPEVETDLLRKYVMYARQNVHPVITDNAITEIKDFYVKMRNSNNDSDNKAIPISARQLEALVRLTEASAKSRLSQKATKRDARRAIDLLQFCLSQIGVDTETGQFDIDQLTTGITTRQRNKTVIIRTLIKEVEEEVGKIFPVEDLVKLAETKGISAEEVDEAIEKLKRSGDIFSPRPDFISRI